MESNLEKKKNTGDRSHEIYKKRRRKNINKRGKVGKTKRGNSEDNIWFVRLTTNHITDQLIDYSDCVLCYGQWSLNTIYLVVIMDCTAVKTLIQRSKRDTN